MPRIPGPSDIPDVAVQNTRRVVDVPVDPTGQALQEFGRAAEQVAGRVREARVKSALAEADLDATRELAAIEKSGLTDDDPDTFAQRAREAATKVFAERGAKLRDGMARRAWELRSKEALGTFELRAADVSRRRSVDLARADLTRLGETARRDAVDPTLPPEVRARAEANYKSVVQGYVERGVLGDGDAAQEIARFDTTLRTERGRQSAATFAERIDSIAGTLAAAPQRFDELVGGAVADIQADQNLDAEVKTRLIGAARQGAAVSTVQALIEADPGRTLKLLQSEKAGGAFAALGDKRVALINAAQSAVRQRKVEFETRVRQTMTDHVQAIQMGLPVDKPLPIETVRAAAGDIAASNYEFAVTTASAFAGYKTAPDADLLAAASQPDPDPSKGPKALRLIQAQRQAAVSALNQRQTDPVGWAIQSRLAPEAGVAAAFNSGDVGAITNALKTRATYMTTLAGRHRTVKPKPLTADEAKQMGQWWRTLSGGQRAELLTQWSRTLPAEAYGELAKQLQPTASLMPMVASLVTQQRSAGTGIAGRDAADILLRGEDLFNPAPDKDGKVVKMNLDMPKQSELDTAWQAYVGNAYAGAEREEREAKEAFRYAYAALGQSGGRLNGMYQADIGQQALMIATGGVSKRDTKSGKVVDRVLLPWGMDEATFNASVNAGVKNLSTKYEVLRGYSGADLKMRALGYRGSVAQYGVSMPGGGTIVIEVDPRLPAAKQAVSPSPAAPKP